MNWYVVGKLRRQMHDIKIRNVELDDTDNAMRFIKIFLKDWPDRKGISNGVVYSSPPHKVSYYVYRTAKTIVCVGYYSHTSEQIVHL